MKQKKIITNFDKAVELQKTGKYSMRSCWKCNSAHEYFKTVGGLFICFECGRWYMNGGYFDNKKHCNKPFIERKPLKTIVITSLKKRNEKNKKKIS